MHTVLATHETEGGQERREPESETDETCSINVWLRERGRVRA